MKAAGAIGRLRALAASGLASVLAACGIAPSAPAPPRATVAGTPPPPGPGAPAPARVDGTPIAAVAPPAPQVSAARTPRDYRRDAAAHLYALHRERVFTGRLPPMLYAVGVLEVDLDGNGHPRRLNWLRAPRHAPEVVAEIERMVRASAPYPRPVRMGRVTYTDTWLWDKSGRFQLDTLTEGQD
ncbi:hypothetical protein WG922_04760 [Ramlibacter sp. AN1015]|uniref:hypothetical protein n=1 Tax=Ramlibacter sp. AN1015 TaxID=3133428 RepID=UPI0030BB30A8